MQSDGLTFFQRIGLETLWGSARLFSILPHWFKYYVVEEVIFWILCYVVRYRKAVVKENLRNSFPDKSEKELWVIRRGFYRTLAEVVVDTINLAHKDVRKVRSSLKMNGLDEHRAAVAGRDWIAITAHFGCWEYCSCWGAFEPSQMTVAVYHPLHSKVLEGFYQRLRNNPNSMATPMNDSLRFYLRNREKGIDGKRLVMGLIADQNPPLRPSSRWFRFLNQDTVFFDGGEKLALRCKLPMYFVKMERLGRGSYQMTFQQIYDGVEPVEEYEITERYIRHLEAMIVEHPELWMWSHRRWKHKRTHADG